MAQHDYVLNDAAGAAFRADINAALAAIASSNSGATEPAPTVAYQIWADTTANLLKIRNAANNAWITIGSLGTANLGLATAGAIGSSGLTQATARLLGRTTAGTGAPEEISVGSGLTLSGGQLTATGGAQIRSISASVSANALTISASALSLDFRSTTLGSGTVTTVTGTPANLVISSGSTLGTVSAVQSDIAVLAINNAGTIELAAVNLAGGTQLDETNLISTTAEGGAGAADSANVIYSTTARTNVAYRVLGIIRSTQTTAGTWATAPSLIQGAGGFALGSLTQQIRLANSVASTSGTAIDFTGIPAGAKRITVMFSGVSTNGSSGFLIQIGDSGGIENTGYTSATTVISNNSVGSLTTSTAGFIIASGFTAANTFHGTVFITHMGSNLWSSGGSTHQTGTGTYVVAGSKTLSDVLDRVRVTTVSGDTFDAGTINISWE